MESYNGSSYKYFNEQLQALTKTLTKSTAGGIIPIISRIEELKCSKHYLYLMKHSHFYKLKPQQNNVSMYL